jgi:hypothetical protein
VVVVEHVEKATEELEALEVVEEVLVTRLQQAHLKVTTVVSSEVAVVELEL